MTIDGKAHPALLLTNDHEAVTLALDPQTNLIRRASFDITKALSKRGAQDIAKAVLTMDYATSTPGVPRPSRNNSPGFRPPGRATSRRSRAAAKCDMPAVAMVGKPAPDFTLKDINGKDVKLADLKGNVLVFDFWATWCPPCVAAMPGLNELAEEMKDQGVKVVAITRTKRRTSSRGSSTRGS